MKISLRKKILLLTLGLVIASVSLIGVSVLISTDRTVNDHARQQLVVGERILNQLLDEHGSQLLDSASVLVDDFGFKQAVTSEDEPTIASALENSGSRINADLIALVDRRGQIISQIARDENLRKTELETLLGSFQQLDEFSDIALIEQRIYQIVVLPVRAPLPVAWVIIGLEMDHDFALQLKTITNLDVSFGSKTNSGESQHFVSTVEGGVSKNDADSRQPVMTFSAKTGERFLSLNLPLRSLTSGLVLAVLHASLDDAYLPFNQLLLQILSIIGLALALAVLGAFITSRNITQPIADLVTATKRISEGDYEQRISTGSKASTEILDLGHHFEAMQLEIKEREAQLSLQAFVDPLTGLASRVAIQETIDELIHTQKSFAVIRLNINRFKEVNDTFGYEIGDRVLRYLGSVLSDFVGNKSLCARFGGDEFAAVLVGVDQSAMPEKVRVLSEQTKDQVTDENVAISSIRLGGAHFPEHGATSEMLLRRAEIALYKAKDLKSLYACYEAGEEESHRREVQLVADLKKAICQNELELYYQPKYCTRENRVTQVEALLRWIHDDFGFVSPEEFISLAEQSGQMNALTSWVIAQAATQRKIWLDKGVDINIAINLSAYDLNDRLPGLLHKTLIAHGLSESHLILEVTESAFIDDPDGAIAILNQLRKMGFSSSIDDYGTGYSSLSQLKKLPVNELKIDKSFILKLDEDIDDQKIVKSTIELAKSLSLSLVAEGVETLQSCHLLREWGCDKLQGYYISRPVPASQLEQWLDEEQADVREKIMNPNKQGQ